MNETIEKFLLRNGIDLSTVDKSRFRIRSKEEINPVLNLFCIPGKKIKKDVSVSEILGYSYEYFELGNDLLENLSYFYNENGSGYQTRSIGFLSYDADKMLETTQEVCKTDTMFVQECESGKYVITENGLHRFNVLRFHYICELLKTDKSSIKEYEELKKKYTIPVEVQQTDYVKSYAYFILRKIIPNIEIRVEYNEDYELTGNAVVSIGEKEKVLTDSELISFLKREIENNRDLLARYADMFECYSENLISFHDFLEQNDIDLFSHGVSP